MPLWSARRIIALLLIATLIPAQGLAWPRPLFGWRATAGPSDAIALRVFLSALNSTEQQVMTGPNRPQIYIVFNVDVAVPPANTSLITAADRAWLDQTIDELVKQLQSKDSILDEIAAGDAYVRSMQSATQLGAMPDTLDFEANPNASVPVEQSMSAALDGALYKAGIYFNNGTTFQRGTGTVTFQRQSADGEIVVTGRLVNGQIALTKEFKPRTSVGGLGEPVTIRGTGPSQAPITQTSGEPVNTVTTTPGTTLVFTPPAAAATTQLRIVTSDGAPGDAVYNGQPFHLETSLPAAGAPQSLTATLTTPGGDQQTVNLIRTVTRDGITIYSSPQISFHGGRLAQGTLQGLDVPNGQVVTVTAPGMQTGVTVYTDDIQLGIARVNEALNATSDELVRQRNYVNSQLNSAAAASDPALNASLTQWSDDIDSKMTFISQTRQAMAGTDQPGLQLMLGQRRFEWLTGSWDSFDLRVWYGNTAIEEQFKEHKGELFTDVMRGFTMGAYQQVARMSLVAQFKTVFTGVNEFGQTLTYEELLAENRGLAFDLAMFWVPNKITDSLVNGGFSGELVISSGTPGGRVLVPTRTMTGGGPSTPSGGRPPVTATTTPPIGPVVVAGNKPPSVIAGDPAIPQIDRGLDGKPGAPVTRVADTDVGPTELFDTEMLQVYNTNLTRARAAGVLESKIEQIVGNGEPTAAKTELLYREAIVAEGNINIPRSEFVALAGINVRSQTGGLSEADYQFLGNKLAQDPTYIDNLPNRGRMPQEAGVGDGFRDIFTPAQRDALLKDPRVAQMVADAKSAAAASGTVILDPNQTTFNPNQTVIVAPSDPISLPPGTQRGVAGVADATGTVIVPRNTQPSTGTPTVRDPNVTTLDPNKTTINPNQTVIVAPNTPAISLPPGTQKGAAGVADNTGTVIVPRSATPAPSTPTVRDPSVTTLDPNKTTINPNQTVIVAPNTPVISLPPGTQKGVAGVADNTGTVIVPRGTMPSPTPTEPRISKPEERPATAGPRVSPAVTVPVTPNPAVTARMTDELMQSLPKARQSGQTPQQAAALVRNAMTRFGVGPQQIVTSLRQRLFSARPLSFSDLGNSETAASRSDVAVSLEALGVSSGVAFNVNAVNNGTMPIQLQGEGVVVEPVRGGPSISRAGTNGLARATPQVISEPVEAFCLERVRPVAPPGTQYRVAPPSVQMQHRRLIDILHAAKRVMDVSGLHPDSDPKSYFTFIRQWSIWSRQENFDEKRFSEEFMNQTKKNVESQGVKWTNAMQDTVRKAAPGRWRDIFNVLNEATRLAPRG